MRSDASPLERLGMKSPRETMRKIVRVRGMLIHYISDRRGGAASRTLQNSYGGAVLLDKEGWCGEPHNTKRGYGGGVGPSSPPTRTMLFLPALLAPNMRRLSARSIISSTVRASQG